MNIDVVNEALGIEFPEGEEFEIIAGFIFTWAGRLVEPGEEIFYERITIHVEQVDNTRITKARIAWDPPTDEETPEIVETNHEEPLP